MKGYEIVLIAHPDVSEGEIKAISLKVEESISCHGGEMLKIEDWGNKKLTHKIKKHPRGHYFFFCFLGNPNIIADLDKRLRFDEKVLRYQTIKIEDKKSIEKMKEDSSQEKKSEKLESSGEAEPAKDNEEEKILENDVSI